MKLGAAQAGLVARYARAIFNFGIAHYTDDRTGESMIPHNPMLVLTQTRQMPAQKRRETFITRRDLRPWFTAWSEMRKEHDTAADYLLTTLLLGCRRNEAAQLRWTAYVPEKSMSKAVERTDGKRAQPRIVDMLTNKS